MNRLLDVGYEPWVAPPEFALPRMTEEEALKALKRRIDELVRQERFSGSVLIARQGKAVFSELIGSK